MRYRNYNKRLAWRAIPGARGDGGTIDNGAVVTEEFRLTAGRDRRLAELRADPTVQWANPYDRR
jgi:hypothetical protein